MLKRDLRIVEAPLAENAIVMGTVAEIRKTLPSLAELPELADDGFLLKMMAADGRNYLIVAGSNDRGVLYGVFALLRRIA